MILLDTNALLWLAVDDSRLGPEARKQIADDTPTFYSSVSTAEITIKHASGKLPLPGGNRFPEVFKEIGIWEMPLNSSHSAGMLKFPELNGHDPFDRLLVAQANDNRCNFLTADGRLLDLGLNWIVDARK